ncbi:MAG: hypothetical protein L6Q97_10420 [Thermoanaerobaculia bacterium]|nr:hypothetical protein [Thermoanaerobaculia bacterium]
MKKRIINSLIIILLTPGFHLFGQNVFISKSVLKTADWANFEYKDVLKKAIAGNEEAIQQLFKFNNAVDGVEGIEHNVTCLELIPLASDLKVANALVFTKPKLKQVVLSRMILAQGKTQKPELKKPMESWAPRTWAVLNNKPLPYAPPSEQEMAEKQKKSAVSVAKPGEEVSPSAIIPANGSAAPSKSDAKKQ